MKKLNLKNLKLNANDLLQREQLKTVFGGYGSGTCTVGCASGVQIPNAPDCSASTMAWACINQGGPVICTC